MPRGKIVSLKRTVGVIEDDLRLTLEEQSECATRCANVHRLPQPVQHEDMLVQD